MIYMSSMHRRRFLLGVGAIALTLPSFGWAQKELKVWRVGVLLLRKPLPLATDSVGELPKALRAIGYVEGKNLQIEWRTADGDAARLSGLASDLVSRKVDVIFAIGSAAVGAAQKATSSIPIIMGTVGDPVGSGFVKSLAHPGGNITGLSNVSADLGAKHLELLASVVPRLSRVALLMNPSNSAHPSIASNLRAASEKVRFTLLTIEARTQEEITRAFESLRRERIQALIVAQDAFFIQQMPEIAALVATYRMPSISASFDFAESGGLMSYGPNPRELFRRGAALMDKIFSGAKPSDLPVEEPTKLELIVNAGTARKIGVVLPPELIHIRADKVIE